MDVGLTVSLLLYAKGDRDHQIMRLNFYLMRSERRLSEEVHFNDWCEA